MDISSGLISKTLGALAAATAVSGGTWWMINGGDEVRSHRITRYDRALMDYLEDGGKIQFAVVDGSGNDLTEFPKTFSGTDTQKAIVTVKIKVNGDDNGDVTKEGKLEEKDGAEEGSKGTKNYLKDANEDNSGWTWSCEMTFVKENKSDPTELDVSQKDMILKSDNEGLFGKLKKATTETDNEETKKLKKSFIKKCGVSRGRDKNKQINEQKNNSEIKNDERKEMKFVLAKGKTGEEWGADETKLFFKKKEKFEEWFSLKPKNPEQVVES